MFNYKCRECDCICIEISPIIRGNRIMCLVIMMFVRLALAGRLQLSYKVHFELVIILAVDVTSLQLSLDEFLYLTNHEDTRCQRCQE